MVQDARKFKYSSDYPQPLVVYRNQFTLTAPAGSDVALIRFKHNLPYAPLIIGKRSDTSDFAVSQDINSVGYDDRNYVEYYVDSEYINFLFVHLDKTLATMYVRVLGFAPPDYDGDITLIQNDSTFRLNTDNDYLGVYKQGTLTQQTGNQVSHGLGYAPQARAWNLVHRYVTNPSIDVTGYTGVNVVTDSQKITVPSFDSNTTKGYYQIYTTEA